MIDFGSTLGIITLVVAIGAAIFSGVSTFISNKTFKAELIATIYEKYHSPEMRRDNKKAWAIYRLIWIENCDNKEEAEVLSTRGEPITNEMAIAVVKKMEKSPKKFCRYR